MRRALDVDPMSGTSSTSAPASPNTVRYQQANSTLSSTSGSNYSHSNESQQHAGAVLEAATRNSDAGSQAPQPVAVATVRTTRLLVLSY